MKVGIPCMKCSLHPSMQVHTKTGKASKTCSIDAAWKEMNDLREGRDTTIDKSLTSKNVWMEGSTTDDIEGLVKQEIDEINKERKEHGLRSMRKDAVSVAEIIEKPPIDYMQKLSYEEKKRFLFDSHNVMTDLINKWNEKNGCNWKMIAAVQHHDEFGGLSAHNHSLVMLTSKDKNDVACMNAKKEFNLKFFNFINSNYASAMREKGYDVEDVKTYDKLSEEEKAERKLHPQEHGVDAYTYKQKQAEKLRAEVEELKSETVDRNALMQEQKQLLKDKEELSRAKEEIAKIAHAPSIEKYENVVKENLNLKKTVAQNQKTILALQEKVQELKKAVEEWKSRFKIVADKAGKRLMKAFGFDVQTKNEFPDEKVASEMNSMKQESKKVDPDKLRVISDFKNVGKFAVVLKTADGTYKTIKSGFGDRQEANDWRIGYADSVKTMSEHTDRSIKRN